jgi:hypothetical protein
MNEIRPVRRLGLGAFHASRWWILLAAVTSAVLGALYALPALVVGLALVIVAVYYEEYRWINRKVTIVDDELVIANSWQTTRVPLASITEVQVGKSLSGRAVWIRARGRKHYLDATVDMNVEQLDAAAEHVRGWIAASIA